MLFKHDRKEILAVLENLRVSICCYRAKKGLMCDCKYGGNSIPESFGEYKGGEGTGCPEIRYALAVLEEMSDELFDDLMTQREQRYAQKWKEDQKKTVKKTYYGYFPDDLGNPALFDSLDGVLQTIKDEFNNGDLETVKIVTRKLTEEDFEEIGEHQGW